MPQRIFETCQVEGCTRKHKARGYCAVHYQHWKRGMPIRAEIKVRDRTPRDHCSEQGCVDPVKAKGLCKMHYARLLRHGHTRYRDRKTVPAICAEPGCDSHVYAKALCHQHWQRRKKARSDYGLTPEQLAALTEEHAGKCAICTKEEQSCDGASGKRRGLSIDHDHSTGVARGLLCNRCNRGLGYFGDSIDLLRLAIAYLERHRPPSA